MLDVSLFRERTFTGSSIAAFGLSMAVLGPVLCLVVYMSFDQGYSELTIGSRLLLLTGVTLPFLPLTGFLDKYVPVRLLICSGLVLVATGLWLMSRLSAAGSLSELVPGLIVAGVGLNWSTLAWHTPPQRRSDLLLRPLLPGPSRPSAK